MSQDYTLADVEQAIQKAHQAGDNQAVNELVSYHGELKAKEKQEFTTYDPQQTSLEDVGTQLQSTVGKAVGEAGQTIDTNLKEYALNLGSSLTGREQGVGAKNFGQAAAFSLTEGVLPAAGETVMAGAKAAGQLLSNIAPDEIEKPTVETLLNLAYNVKENPWIQETVELAKEGYSHYLNWKKDNQERAREFETIFDLALIAGPRLAVGSLAKQAGDAGGTVSRKGTAQGIERRRGNVQTMLEPTVMEKGAGTTEIQGALRSKTYIPSPFEEEAIKVVSLIKDVKPHFSYTHNRNAVNKEIKSTAERLTTRIVNKGNPAVDAQRIANDIRDQGAELIESGKFKLAGGTPTFANPLLDEAVSLIEKSDGTALGLLKARQELDDFIKSSTPVQLTPDYINGKKAAVKLIRDIMNKEVGAAVPSVDVDGLLRKQHLMYTALDELSIKAKLEGNNTITRAYGRLKSGTGLALPTTPLALGATAGAAGTLFSSGIMPYLTGAVGAAASGALTYKVLRSPEAKKTLGAMLTVTSKALRATDDVVLKNSLKADRLVLIALLQEQHEKEKPPLKGAGNK